MHVASDVGLREQRGPGNGVRAISRLMLRYGAENSWTQTEPQQILFRQFGQPDLCIKNRPESLSTRSRAHMRPRKRSICVPGNEAYASRDMKHMRPPRVPVFYECFTKTNRMGYAYASRVCEHMRTQYACICVRHRPGKRLTKHSGRFLLHRSGQPNWRNKICCGSTCFDDFLDTRDFPNNR